MRHREVLTRRAASNMAALRMDRTTAMAEGDTARVTLLDTLASCGADILVYRPQLQHYVLLFGDIEKADHVALMIPGVGDGSDLCHGWIPGAMNVFDASPDTAVILWKGYDNPPDLVAAAEDSIACDEDLIIAASELTAFVDSLQLDPDQSLTVVAHSFGSVVLGAALADCGLEVTDVVVAGSPGMTVDELRELHLSRAHFFTEQAPGDAVAELGIFGSAPSTPTFGGTRMATNAPNHPPVSEHSEYFEAGSEALENIADVVTGHYEEVEIQRVGFPEVAGGLVAWALRLPAAPVRLAGRHYRGPGFRFMTNWCRLVDFKASETGNLVTVLLDANERALGRLAHILGTVDEPGTADAPVSPS